jgi:hypothetical protein
LELGNLLTFRVLLKILTAERINLIGFDARPKKISQFPNSKTSQSLDKCHLTAKSSVLSLICQLNTTNMKKLICITAAIVMYLSSFAQDDVIWDHAYYLRKSNNEKTTAYIALGVSAATIIPGYIMLPHSSPGWEHTNLPRSVKGAALMFVGTISLVTSVIMFHQSSMNKRRAEHTALQINKPVAVYNGLKNITLPYSVGVSITLR